MLGIQVIFSILLIAYAVYFYYTGNLPTSNQLPAMLMNSNSNSNIKKLVPPDVEDELPSSNSVLHIFEKAAICSDSKICSEIGKRILLKEGSAVDSALATMLCNGLIAMQSMGIGGGFVMQVYSRKEKRSYNILSREVAPSADVYANSPIFHNSTQFFLSGLSIGVPAELMGYAEAHERFGKLPWKDLVQPTIDLCHEGFVMTKHQFDSLGRNADMIKRDFWLNQMFVDPITDDFLKAGSHIEPPKRLCETYEIISREGPRTFYTGSLAHDVLRDLRELNSSITVRDLKAISVKLAKSEVIRLGDNFLHLMPPPSSGYIVGFIQSILRAKLLSEGFSQEVDVSTLHFIIEALKFGFVKRWQMDNDADKQFLLNLTCPDYAEEISEKIQHVYKQIEEYGATEDLMARMDMGTAQISVLAPNGDAVSVTSSINFYFGSGRTGSRTGILFNNAMSDFNVPNMPNHFGLPKLKHKNTIKSGQSPMSSMSPIIATNKNGDVRLVIGAAGGSRIISVLSQVLLRILHFKENVKTAIDAPRLHHQLLPNVLEYEYGLLQSTVKALETYGHHMERYSVVASSVCGIEQTGGRIFANADFRKDGDIAGF